MYLLVDVGLGDEGIKDVQDTVDVPHLVVLLEDQNLVRRSSLQLAPELNKRLELQRVKKTKERVSWNISRLIAYSLRTYITC